MGDAAGRPQLVELGERHVDKGADRPRVADRSDAADRLAGVLPDELAEARRRVVPSSRPTFATSTRCAPLVMINSGVEPSAAKISELAIAPTGQPTCSAAARAVGAASPRIRTRPGSPAAARMSLTAWQLGCNAVTAGQSDT